jgi:methylglutaconyl-CoA hydratase
MANLEVVLFEHNGPVATVTLNRPALHNAFNDEIVSSLGAVWERVGGSNEIRVVVIKGAGPSFSGGGDLDYMRKAGAASREQNVAGTMAMAKMLQALRDLPQVTLALVHGNCMAGAAGVVAAADIAIAVEDTKFAFSEVKLGLTPATISPHVVSAIGARNASRYFLTGERFTAVEAQQIGLIHEVVGDDAALAKRGSEFVAMLLQGAPGAVANIKKLIREVFSRPLDESMMASTAANIADRMASVEGQEGLASFFEKRRPSWFADLPVIKDK